MLLDIAIIDIHLTWRLLLILLAVLVQLSLLLLLVLLLMLQLLGLPVGQVCLGLRLEVIIIVASGANIERAR